MITRLTSDDVDKFRDLLALFGRAFDDPDTSASAPPSDTYLRGRLSDETFIALLAFEGDEICGGLAAFVLHKFEQDRREVYIYDLAVDAVHRRKGIATALIRHLQDVAAKIGAWVIYVQADVTDDPAVTLYQGLGAREDVLHFDIPVSHEPT